MGLHRKLFNSRSRSQPDNFFRQSAAMPPTPIVRVRIDLIFFSPPLQKSRTIPSFLTQTIVLTVDEEKNRAPSFKVALKICNFHASFFRANRLVIFMNRLLCSPKSFLKSSVTRKLA
jgi:hypothetical protein